MVSVVADGHLSRDDQPSSRDRELHGEPTVTLAALSFPVQEPLGDVDERSLVLPVSARRGTMGWQPALQTLPRTIARETDCNFVVIYPSVGERGDDRQFLQFR